MKSFAFYTIILLSFSPFSQNEVIRDSILIIQKKSNSKNFIINRFEKIKIRENQGLETFGYFFERRDSDVVIMDVLNPEIANMSIVPIRNIDVLYHYKLKPENRFGNVMISSGIITCSLGITSFILGTIGNSTKSNFIFDQGAMIAGGLLFPLGIIQIFIGKEANCKTFKFGKEKYEIVKSTEP